MSPHSPEDLIIYCDVCGQKLRVRPERAGRRVRCPSCKARIKTTRGPILKRLFINHWDTMLVIAAILAFITVIVLIALRDIYIAAAIFAACVGGAYLVHKLFTFLGEDE